MSQTLLLNNHESLLQALLRSHGNDVIFTYNKQLQCIAVKTKRQIVFGISTDEFAEHNISQIFTTDISSQLVPLLLTTINGQSTAGNVCTFTESYEVIVEPLYDDGMIIGGLAILRRIPDTENTAKRNDVNYWNAIWRVIPDMLFRVNRQGIFLDFRANETAGLYLPPQDFLGKRMDDVFPSELAIRAHNALVTLFDVGSAVSFRYSLPSEGRHLQYFEARFVLAGHDEALIIVRDITEQHQFEIGIQQSERRFRQLTETAVDLIATHDMDGNFLYVNPAGIAMLGLEADKITTYNAHDLVAPEYLNELKLRLKKRSAGNDSTFRYELEVVNLQQRRLYLDISSSPISDGETRSVLVIAKDITERKQNERKLLSQARQIELYLQNTHDGLIVSQRDGTIMDVNPAYCAMSGRTQESLIGINVSDITVGITNGELTANRKELYETGSVRFRAKHRHKDGHTIDLEISVYVVSEEENQEFIFMRDTTAENAAIGSTERTAKRLAILHNIDAAILSAHNEHEIAEATLSHVQQLVPCFASAVYIFDFDDGLANSIAALVKGIDDENRIKSLPIDHFPHLDNLMAGQPGVGHDLSNRSSQNKTTETIRRAGVQSYIVVPIKAEGQLIGALSLAHFEDYAFSQEDVQVAQEVAQSLAIAIQQVRLNEQVRQYAMELEDLVDMRTEELQSANDRLLELDHLKSKFVSDISHELRTPVNNLMMRLHLLEHDTPEQQNVHLKHLKDQIGYLTILVEDILQISRLEVDKTGINFQDVAINELMDQVYAQHSSLTFSKDLEFTKELGEHLPIVIGDPSSLMRAFRNLVANAINYTEKGSVSIRTRFDEHTRHVAIDIEDTGIGIDADDIPHIFDRFYRGSRVAKSKILGTGLGLGIAAEIIKLHRGRIDVESDVGKGSRFTVWLPAMLDSF